MKRTTGTFLMAAALLTTGCAASAGYNRGYYRQGYGGGNRYDRDWDRSNSRDRDRRDDRYRHGGSDHDRDNYHRY